MPFNHDNPEVEEKRKWKWARPVITIIIVIAMLIFLKYGDKLNPLVYSVF